MRILLDTHTILWWLMDDVRLGTDTFTRLESGGSDIVASIVSLWEVAIKHRIGKLNATAAIVAGRLAEAEINVLPVRLSYLTSLEQLPLHHRDPFDRMLVATALTETMQIMTADPTFARYGVSVLDARS